MSALHGRVRIFLAAGIALLVAGGVQPAGAVRAGRGLPVLKHVPYAAGADISFAGDRAFFTQGDTTNGRVRIFDTKTAKPKVIGDFACGGNQNDVAALSEDIIAVGSHVGSCMGRPASGINLIDVSDPKNPKPLGFAPLPVGTHTLTVHPEEPLIYASNSINDPNFVIDVSDPMLPVPIPSSMQTCHDISFHFTKKKELAFCAGAGQSLGGGLRNRSHTQIWDVSDPLAPTVVARIQDNELGYHHSAMATPDGKYLLIGDEDSGGSCSGNTKERELGALSIYDITNLEKPELVGFMNAPRGPSVCWAHNFNFVDNRTVVMAWWQGGTSVIDISTPAKPKEIAHFQPDSERVWSSYFYKDRIWVNGSSGAWVLDAKGL